MSACKPKQKSYKEDGGVKGPVNLHKLVERSLGAHKKDIELYTTGHLNFNRFTKPNYRKIEKSAQWTSMEVKQPKRVPSSVQTEMSNKKMEAMSNALYDFSFGSSGIIPGISSLQIGTTLASTSPLEPTPSQEKVELSVLSKIEHELVVENKPFPYIKRDQTPVKPIPQRESSAKKLLIDKYPYTSKAYVEELKLPELMLSPISSFLHLPPSLQVDRDTTQRAFEKKRFITTHLAGITRKDQFQKMVDFDENVLQKTAFMKRNVFDGHAAVAHLEKKLVRRLLLLQIKQPPAGSSFERLQIYSDVWNDLILDSTIFGSLLDEIKTEYDSYLSTLLDIVEYTDLDDAPRSLHAIEDAASGVRAQKADGLLHDVEDLERQCKDALLRNHNLNERIACENRRIELERLMEAEEESESYKRLSPSRRRGLYTASTAAVAVGRFSKSLMITKAKTLMDMRSDIWKQIDAIRDLKRQLKQNYIPKTLYRNKLHAIKEIEQDIQKLRQQQAYLLQHKEDLFEQIKHAFVVDEVSDEDQKTIWQLISSEELTIL